MSPAGQLAIAANGAVVGWPGTDLRTGSMPCGIEMNQVKRQTFSFADDRLIGQLQTNGQQIVPGGYHTARGDDTGIGGIDDVTFIGFEATKIKCDLPFGMGGRQLCRRVKFCGEIIGRNGEKNG